MGKIATIPLAVMFIITFIVAYAIAWYYRNEYDPKKYLKAYLIYAAPFLIASVALQIRWILIAGIYLFGGIILVFRNQHYFDH